MAKKQAKKKASSKKKKMRLGIIGIGGIAGAHVKGLQHRDDVEFVALADINQDLMDQRKEEWGFQETYTSWKDMLKKADLDGVSVCTPNFLHKQPTIDALNAGCHVIVEKPMAMNAKEAQAMVNAAKKNKKELCIGFQHRFDSRTQMIKRAVDEGTLGDIKYARVKALRRRGIPNWGVFGRKELQGGGPMIDIGVHAMEMAHYAMGSPKPVAASGQIWTYMGNKKNETASMWPDWDYKTYTVEDLAVGMIRFENGAVMNIESSFAGHMENEGMNFTLMGTKGSADQKEPKLRYDRDGYMFDATPAFLPKTDYFKYKMDNFVDCSLYGKTNEEPGEHGLMLQKMLDGIYLSAEKGKEVVIK